MRPRIEYEAGEKIGQLTYLYEWKAYEIMKNKNKPELGTILLRKAFFRCECGNEFITFIHKAKSENIISCEICTRKRKKRNKDVK